VKEIVLTGVNIGDFGHGQLIEVDGRKKREYTFFDLVKAIDDVDGIERLRISSIEPNLLSNEIIEFVSRSKKFVPHFHIPLQSGSNTILKKMKRRYLRELYAERVQTIKTLMPDCCIGVDVLVGFPGETEEEFNETYEFLNQLDISYLHVFTYSERANTPAAEMDGSIPMNIRKQRNKMLRILSAKKLRAFYEKSLNTIRPILFEHENRNGFMYGYSDNYVKVKLPYDATLVNKISDINISGFDEEGLLNGEFAKVPASL
jgi:threonylcarbamoyladenosine tRNA methylthiotransferase MtaB